MAPHEPTSGKDVSGRDALRSAKLAARLALPSETHQTRSRQIEIHLEKLLHHHLWDVLGFYWPIRAEFDCRPLVTRLLAKNSTLHACLPFAGDPEHPLTFHAWTPGCPMQTDRYGIPFPAEAIMLIPDVLLIPVNAFDTQGYRLGYGTGYFDRTLASLRPSPLTIGIGFELARVASIAPQPHDIPLNIIVTEAGSTYTAPIIQQP